MRENNAHLKFKNQKGTVAMFPHCPTSLLSQVPTVKKNKNKKKQKPFHFLLTSYHQTSPLKKLRVALRLNQLTKGILGKDNVPFSVLCPL